MRLISVSVDPETDTPAKLEEWGRRFHAGPNWTLVTGPKGSISRLLKALRADSPNKEGHSPLFLVGNDGAGLWRRVDGLTKAETLGKVMRDLRDTPAPRSPEAEEPTAEVAARAESKAAPGRLARTPLLHRHRVVRPSWPDLATL